MQHRRCELVHKTCNSDSGEGKSSNRATRLASGRKSLRSRDCSGRFGFRRPPERKLSLTQECLSIGEGHAQQQRLPVLPSHLALTTKNYPATRRTKTAGPVPPRPIGMRRRAAEFPGWPMMRAPARGRGRPRQLNSRVRSRPITAQPHLLKDPRSGAPPSMGSGRSSISHYCRVGTASFSVSAWRALPRPTPAGSSRTPPDS